MACVVLVFYNVHYCLGGIQDQHVCATLFGLYTIYWVCREEVFSWSLGQVLSPNVLDVRFHWLTETFQAKAQLCWLALQSTGDQQLVLDTLFLDP